jgi:hypothetical protein
VAIRVREEKVGGHVTLGREKERGGNVAPPSSRFWSKRPTEHQRQPSERLRPSGELVCTRTTKHSDSKPLVLITVVEEHFRWQFS